MVVVPPTEPACRGERAINVQRRRHEVDRAARAAASGALLVVTVVAAAARATATLEAGGQLGIAIGGAAGRLLAGVLIGDFGADVLTEAVGASERVAGATSAWRHATMGWAARRRARARTRVPVLVRAAAGAAGAAGRDADAASAVARTSRPWGCCAKEALAGAAAVAAVAAIDVDRAGRANRDGRGGDLERAAARASPRALVVARRVAALAAREVNRALDID
eukprot:scaffold52069_cov52-Phaeocystis_antarctica.AAC.1